MINLKLIGEEETTHKTNCVRTALIERFGKDWKIHKSERNNLFIDFDKDSQGYFKRSKIILIKKM